MAISEELMQGEVCSEDTIVRDDDALREPYAQPRFLAVLDQLDRSCRLFIAHSPLVVIATTTPDNGIDVSPRGDAPGFVRVLDDHTLIIPDRTGNNRLDSMGNLVVNNEIGLFFMIPGVHESLRIKGTATMSRDPETMLVVSVYWAFIHCGKALNRSRVWTQDYFVDANKWKLARGTLENSFESAVKLR
jgi:PPOX class probable FMN-dependent enzyme